MGFYTSVIRPVFFLVEPEKIHHFVFKLLHFFFRIPGFKAIVHVLYKKEHPSLRRRVFGIDFPNPVGLAAGFDKDALIPTELAELGFGFVEIGTVTPKPQAGNDKPRMFRLPEDQALINRMGFNNSGVEVVRDRLKSVKGKVLIGGNIGKNKITPNESAKEDYQYCFRELYEVVDYFVVNVSSPNTPDLRSLQDKEPLYDLLSALQELNRKMSSLRPEQKPKPLLLKIAPDLNNHQLDEIIEVLIATQCDGVIATNTSISREGLKSSPEKIKSIGAGGLSGRPLKSRSTEVIRYLATHSKGKFSIIGVGGIHSAEDALEKMNAGADLIQLYTGFIYEGPALIKQIKNQLVLNSMNN